MSELEFWKDLPNIFDAILNYQKKNVEFNNRFINPWIRLGNVFERQDQNEEAVQAFKHATEIDPDTAQNWVDLGDAHLKNGTTDDAVAAYQTAIKLDPKAGWPLSNLGLIFVTQGKYEDAIPLYLESIEILTEDKDKAMVWNRLGNVYRKLNDYQNAFDAFKKADELDGENTGFVDKLDEAMPNESAVAPETILENVIVEQPLETAEAVATETHAEEVETSAAEEQLPVEVTPVEEQPQVEMTPVEESAVAETEAAKATEEIVSETEVAVPVAEETAPVEESVEAVSKTVAEEVPSMKETAEEPAAAAEVEISESKGVKDNVLQLIEDVIAKVEAVFSDTTKVETVEEQPIAEVEENTVEEVTAQPQLEEAAANVVTEETLAVNETVEAEAAQPVTEPAFTAESVTTTSDISQDVAISESVLSVDGIEAYVESLSTQMPVESAVSEEIVEETNAKLEVQEEAQVENVEAVDPSLEAESAPIEEEEIPLPESLAAKLAYDEYLNDVTDTTTELSDHVDEIRSDAPETSVSSNGDVRIAMDTKNAHVWNELGNVYLNAGSYDDAIVSYSKAIELDRQFAWPYSNLALAYVQKGRFAEAILLYQRGIELFSSEKDKATTWNRLGNVYRRVHDYDNAIAAYQMADDLDPENSNSFLRSSYGLLGSMVPEQKPALIS